MAGLVSPREAFLGFGHPAVITVACVLVLSRGLQTSGAVDALTRIVLPANAGVMLSTATLVSLAVGLTLLELERQLDEVGAQVVGLVHHDVRTTAPNPRRKVRAGDILVIEAEAEALATVLSKLGLRLEEAKRPSASAPKPEAKPEAEAKHPQHDETAATKAQDNQENDDQAVGSGEIVLMELAVLPGAALAGRSARDLLLRTRYGLNPLAVSFAIGASCAFLTPIGHQTNTLILGPGGFRFGDYWKLGLPLEILVVAISIPLLLVVWPWSGFADSGKEPLPGGGGQYHHQPGRQLPPLQQPKREHRRRRVPWALHSLDPYGIVERRQ